MRRLILILSAAMLAACSGASQEASDDRAQGEAADGSAGQTPDSHAEGNGANRELVIAVGGEPDNLNPIFGDIFGTIYGDHWPLFSSLYAYDDQLELQPDLAAGAPEIADDGMQVTVQLRDDVTFHDGEPFDAEDVVFTFSSILDPDVGTQLRDALYDSLEAVEAVDSHEVQFTLSRPDPAFVDKLAFGIAPEHVLAGEDLNTATFNLDPIGTGPFVLDSFDEGERMVWEANDDYHGGDVGLDRVIITFVDDENARVSQLESGAIDVDAAGLSPRVAERFDDESTYDVVRIPGEMLALTLPTTDNRLDDAEIRRALGMAINRDAIIDGVYAGAAYEATGPFAQQHWAHDPVDTPYDPDAAGDILAAHRWEPGDDGVLVRDGERFELDLVHGEGSTTVDAALSLADDLADIGVAVEPEALSHADRADRIAEGAVSLQTLGNAYDPELDMYTTYHSSHADEDPGTNPAGINDDAVDAALDEGRENLSRDERAEAYADLQDALADQGSWHYLAQVENQLVVADHVEGVVPTELEGHIHGWSRGLLWNLHEWQLAD